MESVKLMQAKKVRLMAEAEPRSAKEFGFVWGRTSGAASGYNVPLMFPGSDSSWESDVTLLVPGSDAATYRPLPIHTQRKPAQSRERQRKPPAVSTVTGNSPMTEETVKRLEERIAASEERGTLRLAEAMAKLDARFTQMDGRFAQIETILSSISSEVRDVKTEGREERRAMRNLVIGSGIAVVAAVLGVLVALDQVKLSERANMLSGFQAGLALRSAHDAQSTQPAPRTNAPAPVPETLQAPAQNQD